MANNAKVKELKQQLLPYLKERAYVRLEKPVALSSGKLSQSYFDGKQITLLPDTAHLFAKAILEMVNLAEIDAVGGPTLGADAIAIAVSLVAFNERNKKIPAFIVRKEPKKHGLQKMIEGYQLQKGDRVLIVEDVVTSGNSVLHAIGAVEQTGARVHHIVCLVDREEGGKAALSKYRFTPLFLRSELDSGRAPG